MAHGGLGVLTLVGCAVAYVGFHAIRGGLDESLVRWSAPSFLLPIAMAATLDLAPRVRFRNRVSRAVAVLAATAVAAVWFEAVVPMMVASSTGDLGDVAAMMLGGALAATAPFIRRR